MSEGKLLTSPSLSQGYLQRMLSEYFCGIADSIECAEALLIPLIEKGRMALTVCARGSTAYKMKCLVFL